MLCQKKRQNTHLPNISCFRSYKSRGLYFSLIWREITSWQNRQYTFTDYFGIYEQQNPRILILSFRDITDRQKKILCLFVKFLSFLPIKRNKHQASQRRNFQIEQALSGHYTNQENHSEMSQIPV